MDRAVFLDRDGTIAKDVPYCSRPEDFELLPGAGTAIRLLNERGLKVIIITNQSGIARGYFTEEVLERIHHKMRRDLERFGAHIDAIYYCPHHPDDGCQCRKPKPGLIHQAARDHGVELSKSFFIGDKPLDIEAGHSAGCKVVLISDGVESSYPGGPEFETKTLLGASNWILREGKTTHCP